MFSLQFCFILLILFGLGSSQIDNIIPNVASTTSKSTGNSIDPFLPHATYLGANSYVDNVPYRPTYNAQPTIPPTGYQSYLAGMIPTSRSTLEVVLWVFAKIGVVLMGSTVLFLLGGVFNALICYYTAFCTYDFHGFNALSDESVRSLITPEKISTAAALVQDAIGKYNRMQREVRN